MSTEVVPPATDEPSVPERRSRRAILAAGLGGLAGAVAAALSRPTVAKAAVGDPMIVGQDNFAGGSGTRLFATSSGGAFWLTQYGFGSGVRGDSVKGHGMVATTQHQDRYGIFAQQVSSTIGSGAAVFADGGANAGVRATVTGGYPAVVATASSFSGTAIQATASGGGSSYGIHASSGGANGAGVFGDGASLGVFGQCNAATGTGVEGLANGQYGVGVHGYNSGSDGHGVLGEVYVNSGNASAIWGYTRPEAPDAYAGYFSGQVAILGNLSKGGGSFTIDHPLDPANRILQHSFVESPDMKNVYDGLVTTDANGDATITLPDWFEALNDRFRYQLTTIGSAARAWVSAEVENNRFAIRSDEPSTKVSWQLTGIRRDAWAKANRISVEVDKAGDQRGRYLHPIAHGQPPSKGVDWEAHERIVARRAQGSSDSAGHA